MKSASAERIGDALQLPELITRGLAANERLEYYLTLLHAAQAHATAPHQPTPMLRLQREASGITDASLDHVVELSTERAGNTVHIPGACTIVMSLFEELRLMLQPLRVAGGAQADLRARVEIYERRLDDLVVHAPSCSGDQIAAGTIRALTRRAANGHDTLHQLITDLFGELSRLQANVSVETIAGASVYNILDPERALIRAYMKGIGETAAVKFDHAGLDTTATHDGERLTIQTDMGTTHTPPVVVHVDGRSVTLTYADIHHGRMVFLREMMQPYDVAWTDATKTDDSDHEVMVGRYDAEGQETLERYLTFLGSRLVFLIAWNRARKRLARLVGKPEAHSLLKWAADNSVGHIAFLKAGDVRLVQTALEQASSLPMPSGARLDEWIGRDASRSVLMVVLHTSFSGLRAGHLLSQITDDVAAELSHHLQTRGRHIFNDIADHATMIAALADRLRRTLTHLGHGERPGDAAPAEEPAFNWTNRTDLVARHAVRWNSSADTSHELKPVWRDADSAADAIEETAFLLTLVPPAIASRTASALSELAEIVDLSVREYGRCLEESRELSAVCHLLEVDGFLMTIDRLVDLGRQARAARRGVTERLLRQPVESAEMFLLASIAHELERASASLARCGPILRDYVLSSCLNR
jgi:hypothetical protein